MNDHGSISQWIDLARRGDSLAAQQIWETYFQQLLRLARHRLGEGPHRVADEEDVVVDAFDSFYRGAQAGRFPKLSDRNDLWQVLVMITARKASNQRTYGARQKRGGGRVRGDSYFFDELHPDERAGIDNCLGSEPTPDFAHQMVEEFHRLIALLESPQLASIAVAKLEGFSNDEIAEQQQVRTRTIERKLRIIREIWDAAADQPQPNSPDEPTSS